MGRPREFDREAVLDRVVDRFWAGGFEATSVQDLVECTGVKRQSLYHAFGDKQQLFLQALERYHHRVVKRNLHLLSRPGPALTAIRSFFQAKVEEAVHPTQPRGCLMTNSAVERAVCDAETAQRVAVSLRDMEQAFHRALRRALDADELAPDADLRALARHLVNSVQGLLVLSKACRARALLQDIVEVSLRALESNKNGSAHGRARRPWRRCGPTGGEQ
ncbi:MAG: TetR/AcrR family transcriptional regulator [Burkholderiales bacterium]